VGRKGGRRTCNVCGTRLNTDVDERERVKREIEVMERIRKKKKQKKGGMRDITMSNWGPART